MPIRSHLGTLRVSFRVCGAAVLSMQALLYAVGLGAGSIPVAAALNWVMKDGLGQLGGKCAITTASATKIASAV
jgi:hypothetical protein